jgi:hypothetical protein
VVVVEARASNRSGFCKPNPREPRVVSDARPTTGWSADPAPAQAGMLGSCNTHVTPTMQREAAVAMDELLSQQGSGKGSNPRCSPDSVFRGWWRRQGSNPGSRPPPPPRKRPIPPLRPPQPTSSDTTLPYPKCLHSRLDVTLTCALRRWLTVTMHRRAWRCRFASRTCANLANRKDPRPSSGPWQARPATDHAGTPRNRWEPSLSGGCGRTHAAILKPIPASIG